MHLPSTHLHTQNALLKEVGLLAKLTHPNLVRFCGVCLDPPLVVMEYYKNGSVYKMLECARAAVQQGRTNKVRTCSKRCTATSTAPLSLAEYVLQLQVYTVAHDDSTERSAS